LELIVVNMRRRIVEKGLVSIVKGPENPSEKEIGETVRKAISLAGGLAGVVSRGDTILIKPNVVNAYHPDTGATTDPRVCKSIAFMIKEMGANPVVVESSSIGADTEESFRVAGYQELRNQGFRLINLKEEENVTVPVPEGQVFKEISLPRIVVEADAVISVPRMKTHEQAKVTLGLKNMKGILPDVFKRKFHLTFGIFQGVADLCTVIKPAFSVVDAIVAMEGLGPTEGTPVNMDLIIAGKDPVAVDVTAGLVMGFEIGEDETAVAAAASGIGTADLDRIDIVGESVSSVKRNFKRADEAIEELVGTPDDFQLIFAEKACTGCRNSVMMSLKGMKERDLLEEAEGWTVIAGKVDSIPQADRSRLLLIGKCTARFKDQGLYIDGCPPHGVNIAGGILGKTPTDELTLDWVWTD